MQIFEQKSTTKNGISLYSTKYNISKITLLAERAFHAAKPLAIHPFGYFLLRTHARIARMCT